MKKISKRNKVIFGVGLLAILIVTFTASYAYWQLSIAQTDENLLGTGCFDITFTEKTSAINLAASFPMSDAEGLEQTPYTFTIKNICSYYVAYQVNLETLPVSGTESKLSDDYVKIGVANNISILSENDTTSATITEAIKAYKIASGELDTDEEITYEIRMWLDEDAPQEEAENKVFKSKITITASIAKKPIVKDPVYLGTTIMDNNTIKDGTALDFSVMSDSTTTGLYSYPEEGGTSYFFRGDKEALNNNVIFAEHQWKIIRIDKDGNIKLIYNGTCPNNSCTINDTGTSTQVQDTAFNTSYNLEKYIGYTYDTNIDSTIKIANELWYTNNIETNYDSYIADVVYCNDRSGARVSGSNTYYATTDRLACSYSSSTCYNATPIPTLECANASDKFTVSSSKGNGLLSQKTGLITADEVMLAGGKYGTATTAFYLYTNQGHWTMSPFIWSTGTGAGGWDVNSSGIANFGSVRYADGLRPVITLNSNVQISVGDGSLNSPYIIATE